MAYLRCIYENKQVLENPDETHFSDANPAFVAFVGLALIRSSPSVVIKSKGSAFSFANHGSGDTCTGFFNNEIGANKIVFSIVEFGAMGDGKTLNTEAFRKAVAKAHELKIERWGAG